MNAPSLNRRVPKVPPILLKLPDNVRPVVQTAALSLAAGFSAVGFLFLTNLLFEKTYVAFAARSKVYFVVASFLLSVYIGAGVASNASGLLGTPPRERRGAAIVGASAGLAAAFNTPLAAVAFVIEEVIGDLNSRFLGRVVLASVLGARSQRRSGVPSGFCQNKPSSFVKTTFFPCAVIPGVLNCSSR